MHLKNPPGLRPSRHATRRNALVAGFALLEALIAVVLIAFGFIALLGVQLTSLQNTQVSRNLTVATVLARDMAERVRVSTYSVRAYDFSSLPPTNPADCYSKSCTPTALFAADYGAWALSVASRLNGGEAIVCRSSKPTGGTGAASPACTNGATDPLVIKLWWTEKDKNATTKESFSMPLFARDISVL